MCAHCEKPFEGRRHFEKKGLAYCERDYKFVSREFEYMLAITMVNLVCEC